MTDVQFRNLSKSFGQHKILEDINLDIRTGEFVVLVGPSGCGKSTLLRMLAGLEAITSGDLVIGGTRANELPPQKRNIAMVFQSYALFPHLKAAENIGFGPKIRGENRAAIDDKVKKASGVLNLFSYLDRYPRQLSGGQRQRVAMGRAIVREPSVFLFDEPLSNLDAQLRVQMRTEIKALHQRLKSTIVYVTHDQIEAMTMADRIVVMDRGRIQQVGQPLELYDRPANKFVAGFIGSPSMSFVSGALKTVGAKSWFETTSGGRLALSGKATSGGDTVEAGIRPEHFVVGAGDDAIAIKVDVVEPTGSETHVYGSVGDDTVRAVFRDRLQVKPGDRLPVSVDPRNIHLFDKATGLPL
ncbi:sn-glycerol-3-phosphate ABC transporter ATP-binding protein UgpC [Mesorhizobium sp. B3-1-3]|uniref:ABC transporter ATP-binding protein n=1 Tax=unclassified Mesorhizobium TaxID=325217 RepID=UPI00112974AD|nr:MULTISPECIES: sn-glycerol-3-phosphate ABC transporter ATP-binding protein UgpC [unclassified Mesorhizobium]TPI46857.1 sn-glycerol-3-phosphate ABC transporter ATP-binding protein UgpC [Mesorhizobium sp. B3-1-7]TPI61174.1 sn-glycerol-3-phosphate ABC transporter ATP-binding protein UgpC [Mesorhizobium sp. B3-1-8]TPI63078.1 sn-glycerol-3-phosphate ABC transporter ATP-binding protein UgpC [Mesorhizobium sp. B3-1-3]